MSPYSLFAFAVLRRYAAHPAWKHVKIEYVPIFLGGIMQGTGNKPPGTLPARAKQGQFDTARSVGCLPRSLDYFLISLCRPIPFGL